MLPPLRGHPASLPPRTRGRWQRTTVTFPPRRGLARRGPFTPNPSVWKKGPRLPPRLPQEIWSLEVRGQPAAPPVGAKQPNAGACSTPERRGGRQSCGKRWGNGQAFPVYVTTRPPPPLPKKGRGLGKLVALGRAPAKVCLRLSAPGGIASLGQGATHSLGKWASSSQGGWGYVPGGGACEGLV